MSEPGPANEVDQLARTAADVWSIEAAVESGRRGARFVERDVTVIEQHKPVWLRRLGWIDDQLYRLHAPHLLDLLAVAIPSGLVALFARHRALRRSPRVRESSINKQR